jgi:hypothetical protein
MEGGLLLEWAAANMTTCNKLNMLKLCTFNEDWTATEYTLS